MVGCYIGCLGSGNIFVLFMLLCKCSCICGKLQIDCSKLSPKVTTTYAIIKTQQNELSIYYMTFAYLYNWYLTFIFMLICNCTISYNSLFIIGAFESYIMQCKPISGTCILTNIQWLLLWKIVENNCLHMCVWFLWMHVCFVGNLMTIIFEHIRFALHLLGVGCSTIYLDWEVCFHHLYLIKNFHVNSWWQYDEWCHHLNHHLP